LNMAVLRWYLTCPQIREVFCREFFFCEQVNFILQMLIICT